MSIDFIKGLSLDEQEYVWSLRELLINIVEDFKKQGLLRKQRNKNELQLLDNVIRHANNHTAVVNVFAERLGLKKINVMQFNKMPMNADLFAYVVILIFHYIIQAENFRNLFLYLLDTNKTFKERKLNRIKTLGQLMMLIYDISPTHWKRLDDLMSSPIRNVLAHSLFWINDHKIQYIRKDDYNTVNSIDVVDFIQHAMQQNMITRCLNDLINEYYKPTIK